MYNAHGRKKNHLFDIIFLTLGLGGASNALATTVVNTTLPTGSLSCNVMTSSPLSCGQLGTVGNVAALSEGTDGVTGLKFYLTGNVVDNESANTTDTTTLTFTTTGMATGNTAAAGILVPFTYDFSLAANATGTLTGYTMLFNIQQGSTSIFASEPTFTNTFAASTTSATATGGNQFLTINPITAGQAYTITAELIVNWKTGAAPAGLTITVPQNSFDTNSNTFVSTPEPASCGFLAIGL